MGTDRLQVLEQKLARLNACERIDFLCKKWPQRIIMTSSFGLQSAVTLHLVTRVVPSIPVVLIDTGYLFPETYGYADQLTRRLRIKLHVYRPRISPAWLEKRHGRLWEMGLPGINKYNYLTKIEPMHRALDEWQPRGWISGLRRMHGPSRRHLGVLAKQKGVIKIHPFIDWTDDDLAAYMKRHRLPEHPLAGKGYDSIGDYHLTHPVSEGNTNGQGRFFGLKRECGLHESAQPVYH